MSLLDIVEVGRRTGLPASALRHYEAMGLISSVGRRGLRRTFEPSVIDTLALIRLGIAAGFSLDEIGTMLPSKGSLHIERHRLARKADDLDREIARLKAIRDGLRHAALCPAPSHMQCPTFRRLLAAASDGQLQAQRARQSRRRHAAKPR